MTDIQIKTALKEAINRFATNPLRPAAMKFFATLGYESERTLNVGTVEKFCDQFDPEGKLNHHNAQKSQWQSIELLFQLTDEELSRNASLFKDTSVKASLLQSYVFFAVELKPSDYARGKLASITRQINRIFPMPVMVLFKVDASLSVAVINRRQNKRDESKDVLGKVTLIQNISIDSPHPGHLDILASFSTTELAARKKPIGNFDQLHSAWEEIFNVDLLNEKFYEELSNWYFWARRNVSFPADLEPDEEKRNSTSVIRLLTRIIFCWFIKEKGLIPETLFDKGDVAEALVSLDDDESTYYRAILQNLFFATLNQQMNAKGKTPRQFAENESFVENRSQYGIKNLYRYKSAFRDPANALTLFEDIPYLNGGLFACLDPEDDKGVVRYADGFSRNPKKQPIVPNYLFFSERQTIDLSADYGESKKKKASVRGLINILRNYKFTIAENTPVEQEIALDPELLGKVFENLLASYNPETGATARKQTGSFYTPRTIVDYMVDESLKAYLAHSMQERLPGTTASDAIAGLDILFAYTEREHAFSEREIDALIDAIDACNILDPACGSGAFPMGILHKLVFILGKLDPHNEKWRNRQIAKAEEIEDVEARDSAVRAIERDFADNALDYGRKLYLIENCIYGVDIQPIAIQISKLRFFISLVCDQKTNRDKARNHGIRPLPNLETKFVAADTLSSLNRDAQRDLFANPKIAQLEKELEKVRHRYFSAQTRQQKRSLQQKDGELCREIIGELNQASFADEDVSKKIASWNPYDHYVAADFFDPEWMFGPSVADGFDVVIGNPPYLKERDSKHIFDLVSKTEWGAKYHVGKMDYWFFFLHRALHLTKALGIISFITSRYWINSSGSKKLVKHIQESASLFHVVDIGSLTVFEQVAGQHMLHFYKVKDKQSPCLVKRLEASLEDIASTIPTEFVKISTQQPEDIFTKNGELKLYRSSIELDSDLTLGDRFEVTQGVVQNPDKVSAVMAKRYGLPRGEGVFVLEKNEISRLPLNHKELGFVKSFYDESSIYPFHLDRSESKVLLYLTKKNCPSLNGMPNIEQHLSRYKVIMDARRETIGGTIDWFQLHWPRDLRFFESPKIVIPSMFRTPCAAYVPESAYVGLGSNIVIGGDEQFTLHILCALLNSSFGAWWFATNSKKRGVGVDVGVDRLRQFPLPSETSKLRTLEVLTSLMIAAKNVRDNPSVDVALSFMQEVIDACVFEVYFSAHMAERKLGLTSHVFSLIQEIEVNVPDEVLMKQVEQFYEIANSSKHPIRNILIRIPVDSPELLAVIQKEGAV